MALNVGNRLGHYDVTALIGEGGMGPVYRAADTQLRRDVALKILHKGSDPGGQNGNPGDDLQSQGARAWVRLSGDS